MRRKELREQDELWWGLWARFDDYAREIHDIKLGHDECDELSISEYKHISQELKYFN
jgi:hypothetical protein